MNLLFSAGTARGGTNLVIKMLNVSAEAYVAIDAFLGLFRQLRNDVLLTAGDGEVAAGVDPGSPIDDYYYSALKFRMMQLVQAADLDLPFSRESFPGVLERLTPRTALSAVNLVPFLADLPADTYHGVFRNCLRVIERAALPRRPRLIGFHENWAVEFLTPLARAFPDARFLIIVRDPRACIASVLRVDDPRLRPHVLSFARSWRKLVAFVHHYEAHPLFAGRLMVVRYEDVVADPEHALRGLADHVGIVFDPAMLDARNFREADGTPWRGNSLQGARPGTIYRSSIDAWRATLAAEIAEAIEIVAGEEMALLGYAPERYRDGTAPSAACLAFCERDDRGALGWRVGGDHIRDIGSELLRRAVLRRTQSRPTAHEVASFFLFAPAYERLRAAEPRSARMPPG